MYDSWGDGWDGTRLKIIENIMVPPPQPEPQFGSLSRGGGFLSAQRQPKPDTVTETTTVMQHNFQRSERLIFRGTLRKGRELSQYVCLESDKCYRVETDGGMWVDEVKWEIRAAPLGMPREERLQFGLAVAKGGAPTYCQFSIIDRRNPSGYVCPFSCDSEIQSSMPSASLSAEPSSNPTTMTPTAVRSEYPSVRASQIPTVMHSKAPSSVTPAPTNLPTKIPTIYTTKAPSSVPSDQPSLVPSGAPSQIPYRRGLPPNRIGTAVGRGGNRGVGRGVGVGRGNRQGGNGQVANGQVANGQRNGQRNGQGNRQGGGAQGGGGSFQGLGTIFG